MTLPFPVGRRALLAALASAAALPLAIAQTVPRRAISFLTWSNALDQLREHIAEFSRATGLRVSHQHLPWSAYRTGLATRLRAGAALDVVWMSDAWLTEFSEAGHLAPIDDLPELAQPFEEMLPVCADVLETGGRRWGLPYYTDYITFVANTAVLARAGIAAPPATWEEVAEQCRHIAARGISRRPLLVPLANDPWLAEVLHAMAFAFGTGFADPAAGAATGEAGRRLAGMLRFLRDAAAPGGILRDSALEQDEDGVFRDFAGGDHAFALLPSYRLVQLNDPVRSRAAGGFRATLMPNGGGATGHETCAWVRLYAMTAAAAADPDRRVAATAFMRAFGARDWTGQFRLQRHLLVDLGLPACFSFADGADPQAMAFLERATGGTAALREQRGRLRTKPVEAPWFGAWQASMAEGWREVIAGRIEPEAAIAASARLWDGLRAAAPRRP